MPEAVEMTASPRSTRRQTLRLPSWSDVHIPERKWVIPEWIPRDAVTGIYGDGGVGKSLGALQLQTSLCLGQPWLGLPVHEAGVRSLGVYCEDSGAELLRRQRAINRFYGCEFDQLDDCGLLPRDGEDNVLVTFTKNGTMEFTPLRKELIEQCKDERRTLLIWDSATDGFCGNENDRTQVGQFIKRNFGDIAREIDGTVIVLAHPSRSGLVTGSGDSGSTAWSNSFRSRLYFSRALGEDGTEADPNRRTLRKAKANYSSIGEQLRLKLSRGVIQSEFLAEDGKSDAGRPSVDDVFMSLLKESLAAGRRVSDSDRAGNYAPREFCSRPNNSGYTKPQFKAAMERLFSAKKIELGSYTKNRNKYEHIMPSGGEP
jgi:RecA-family ATPase